MKKEYNLRAKFFFSSIKAVVQSRQQSNECLLTINAAVARKFNNYLLEMKQCVYPQRGKKPFLWIYPFMIYSYLRVIFLLFKNIGIWRLKEGGFKQSRQISGRGLFARHCRGIWLLTVLCALLFSFGIRLPSARDNASNDCVLTIFLGTYSYECA